LVLFARLYRDAWSTEHKIIAVDMVFVPGGSKGPRPDHRDTACFIVPKLEKKLR
jgi:hypothetical protein